MPHAYAIAAESSRVNENLAQGVKDLLSALGNRYVAYYPSLAELTGSPKAALMLGHAMFIDPCGPGQAAQSRRVVLEDLEGMEAGRRIERPGD